MPILNRAAELQDEVAAWRRHIHSNPEINFDLFQTSAFVAEKLKEFGCDEVVTGLAKTGLVGVIKGRLGNGRTVGLRADMDALPIKEATGKPYASKSAGRMHACGHDGHTTMLLGAARYLAETRNFCGSVYLIFQPAEENDGGGRVMIEQGLFERFPASRVFGMHNWPRRPVGTFAMRVGPIMAAADRWILDLKGQGGHAAAPHLCADPVVAGAQIVTALQTIVARNCDPIDQAVVSATQFHAGDAFNVIPEAAHLVDRKSVV